VKRLGDKPLARLVALHEQAIELFKPQTVEAAGAASEVLAQALALAKLLAEGEEDRDWTDDDQEPEAGEDENDQEDEAGEVTEAGQEGEAAPGSTSEAGQEGEAGEVTETTPEAGEVTETTPEAGEPQDRGGKSGRRGRRRGGDA
jgi:hypothetical protein